MDLPPHLMDLGIFSGRRHLRRQLAPGTKANVIVALHAEAAWSTAGQPGMTVHCASGVAWLTQTGDGQDIVLGAGTAFTAECHGKLVVTALEPAVIQIQY